MREGKVLFQGRNPTNKHRGNYGVRKSPFGNHHHNNQPFRKEYQNWWMKVWIVTGYLHTLKVSPRKTLFNYRRKNNNFTVEKPGRHHLNHVINHVNITRIERDIHHVPPGRIHWEHNIPSLTFLSPNHEGTSDETKRRPAYEMPHALQKRQCHEREGHTEELFSD